MAFDRHVVLLHAFPLNSTMWRPQVAAVPANWRVITPDLPGFGSSSESPVATMTGMAESVLRVLDSMSIERAVIGGLSMGGYVTLALYRMAPERFEAMILADTRATADNDTQKDGRRKMIATVRAKGAAGVADEMLPKLLGATSHRERPELSGTVRGMIESTTPDAIAAAAEAMMHRPDSMPLLASIQVPTLIICGDEDVLTPPADARALNEQIRNSRLELLPRAGHLSNLETPDPFSGALRDFLSTLR
jgi:pimeloyl-ACP methyl ester carboxylesterase